MLGHLGHWGTGNTVGCIFPRKIENGFHSKFFGSVVFFTGGVPHVPQCPNLKY